MIRKPLSLPAGLILLLLVGMASSHAETRLIGGYSDGFFSVFAEIERNGVRYRTDHTGSRTNQLLWQELSEDDRKTLGRIYAFAPTHLSAHFGSAGHQAIRDWVNDSGGWTALWEALKNKHANRDFPELTAAFGPDVTLEIPSISASCWEVRESASYIEAVRLAHEVEADFAIGRQVYHMLRDANWTQVEVATKALSGELIGVIVDNFITPFVTNGAAKVSEFGATVYDFVKKLRKFIDDRYAEGRPPPDAADLIEQLDEFISDMEQTALTGAARVAEKLDRLRSLSEELAQLEADCLDDQRALAEETRGSLRETVDTLPPPNVPVIVHDPVPGDVPQSERDAWIFNNLHNKAVALWGEVIDERNALNATLGPAKTDVANDYQQVPLPALEAGPYYFNYPGMSSGFDEAYRRVKVPATTFNGWNLGPTQDAYEAARTSYERVGDDAESLISSAIPQIDAIHARALGLDAHAGILGSRDPDGTIHPMNPLPSVIFGSTGIRDFNDLIDILATSDQTLEQTVDDIAIREAIIDDTLPNLDDGIGDRLAWVDERASEYDSLKFNFENSLSFQIARLRQLTELHEDRYFEPWLVYTIVEGVTLQLYRIAIDNVLADIAAAGGAALDRTLARQAAVRRLRALHARELRLIEQLIIARDSHMNDVQAMHDFRANLYANYENVWGYGEIYEDMLALTGRDLTVNLWRELAPDITYYFWNSGWVQPTDYLYTNLLHVPLGEAVSPYGRVSGKTDSYFELYDLYHGIKNNRQTLLALSEPEFDAWMAQTTITRLDLLNRLSAEGVSGPGWPALELAYAMNHLQESINIQYRAGRILEPIYWQVDGRVVVAEGGRSSRADGEGIGIGDVDLIIEGQYDNGVRVAFPATTGTDGHFSFEFIANGSYTIIGSVDSAAARSIARDDDVLADGGPPQRYVVMPTLVEMQAGDVHVTVEAAPAAGAGHVLAGRIEAESGSTPASTGIVLSADGSDEVDRLVSLADGSFVFSGLEAGTYRVYPAETGIIAAPDAIEVTVPPSRFDLTFIVGDAARIFANGFEQAPLDSLTPDKGRP